MKRGLALLLCLIMCMSLFPAEAFAEDGLPTDGEEFCDDCGLDHDHEHENDPADDTVPSGGENPGSNDPGDDIGSDPANLDVEPQTPPSGDSPDPDDPDPDPDTGELTLIGGDGLMPLLGATASCSHTYTYTYSVKNHSQHTKTGTCSKCGATTSSTENHSFSNKQCTKCGCYEPIKTAGGYDVTAENGIKLYDQNNSSGTATTKPKGTYLYVSSVEVTSSGYYWGKVTKIGTQSATKYVCMKSSELAAHSHSYTYTYSVKDHSQHTKTGTCSKCGGTTTSTENHSFSNKQCTKCGCYEPIKTAGWFEVTAANGIKLYDQNNSSGTATTKPKGTYLYVSSVECTSSGYYWGKVTKIGTQSATKYVCMKSSELTAHSHSYTYTYTVKDHSQHTKTGTCSKCGDTTTATESHSFSNKQCTKCSCYEPIKTAGGYDVIASGGISLYDQNNSSGTATTKPQGTYLYVSSVEVTSSGYYWGKVTKIGIQSVTKYVCMKSSELTAHSHSYSYTYNTKNNVQHTKTGTCSKCGATTSVDENHNFSGGKCTVCSADEPYKTAGTYVANNANGITIYSGRAATAGTEVETGIAKGTHIKVINVQLNSASNNYWGQVEMVGNRAPKATAYVYMGTGTLAPHTHSYSTSYSQKSDSQHNVVSSCSCGYQTSAVASHSFSGGKCSLCGKEEVPHSTGSYLSYRDSEALRSDVYADSSSPRSVSPGTFIEISEVKTNSYGNYWGKVSRIDNEIITQTMYAYLGNLNPHTHTLTTTFSNVNNLKHDRTASCSGCKYRQKDRLDHSFSNGKCTVCGGWQAYSAAGDYITINASGLPLYTQRLSEGTAAQTLPKGTFVQISDVALNEADNYWGRVVKIGSEAPSKTLYIYMGSGQIEPHTHNYTKSYSQKSDSQHTVVLTCSCGLQGAATAESHSFSGGKCSHCGKEEVPHTPGGYLSHRSSEALRSDVYADASSPRSVSPGTFIEISEVKTNSYGNYWGKVSRIDNEIVTQTMYAYLGNLNLHTHTLTTTFSTVNNLKHDKTTACSGCKYSQKERLDHDWSGGKCSACGGWKAFETAGDYITINNDGVKLFTTRLSEGTAAQTLSKGTFVHVEDVYLNDAGNYWGRVTEIGGVSPSKTLYIYMGSGQIEPHTHTAEKSYAQKSDSQHTVVLTCSCGHQMGTSLEDHNLSGGKCSLCGKAEVVHTPGGYLSYRSSEALRSDMYADASSPRSVSPGTFIEISEFKTNIYGNYWGKVSRIDNEIVTQTMYAYLGNLTPHTHTLTTTCSNVNNVQHDKTTACTGCKFSQKERLDHNWSDGKCTVCGGWRACESNGDYITINASGSPLYAQRLSEGTPVQTLPKGSYIQVRDVKTNSANNYWGKVVYIDNAPQTGSEKYIYMGSGNVAPHVHNTQNTYTSSDTQHKETAACRDCPYQGKPITAAHDFGPDGTEAVCRACGHPNVPHTPGDYIVFRASEPLRESASKDAKAVKTVEKGSFLHIEAADPNSYGNYWGKVKNTDSNQSTYPYLYVYMGNLSPHVHSLVTSYAGRNNLEHKKTEICNCGYSKTVNEPHNYKNGVCENCGAWQANETDGSYLVISSDGAKLYKQRLSEGTPVQTLPKGTFVQVEDVDHNSAGYYWGKVVKIGDTAPSGTLYLYMGSGQLEPHTHQFTTVYSSKSDTQHTKTTQCCSVCGFKGSGSSSVESHSFSGGKCTLCGKEEVPHTAGTYVTFRSVETLRADRYESAAPAEKPEAGSCLEVKEPQVNNYGNYWAEVVSINGAPLKTPSYVYMGHVKPHTHSFTSTYRSINNLKHEVTTACSGCNQSTTTTENHNNENGVCTKCTAWEAYTTAGGYLAIKEEGVPVYSKNISSGDSRVITVLGKGTYVEVNKPEPNSAGYYWARVTRIGNTQVQTAQFIYMGRGSFASHTHSFTTTYVSKSDTQHTKTTQCCSVCGFTNSGATVEDHNFSNGTCTLCGKKEVVHTAGLYLTTRSPETLRLDYYATATSAEKPMAGACLEVKQPLVNSSGNYWAEVVSINGAKPAKSPTYVYMGFLQPHQHDKTVVLESVNNKTHKTGWICSSCGMSDVKKEAHNFDSAHTCKQCGALEAYTASSGTYIVSKAAGAPVYSQRLSSGSSTLLKTLPAGTYIEVKDVLENSAGYYWGKVVKIGNYTEKDNIFIYMGRGQLQPHGSGDHDYKTVSTRIVNNEYHEITQVCTLCSYTQTTRARHSFAANGNDILCPVCQAREPWKSNGTYLAAQDNISLYSNRISSGTSKVLKTITSGTCVDVKDIKSNSAGYFWGQVTKINNTAVNGAAMYVYMGRSYFTPHTHSFAEKLLSTSDTTHTYGSACANCTVTKSSVTSAHRFVNGVCSDCGLHEITHDLGGYVTVRPTESFKSEMLASSSEVKKVPAGTYVEVSSVSVNKNGNYWGKVSFIDNAKVTKTMYTYLGNLERHAGHTLEPYYQSKSDLKHSTGKKCADCSYFVLSGTGVHDFANGVCVLCGKTQPQVARGNYVTFRESEPLREKPAESAKVTKRVPAGSRLHICEVSSNGYDNYWGKVDQIDGAAVKGMYVFMGNVTRHEAHDFQPYAAHKSDTQHTIGEKCSGCNLTRNTTVQDHRFASDGVCADCGAAEVAHSNGVYLVAKAGNLKTDRYEDAVNVQYASIGVALEVTDIQLNKYGNYWGKVTLIGTAKPKKTNAYVYLGNLTPHSHQFETQYTVVDQNYHNIVQTCSGCSYKAETKAVHIAKSGKCEKCGSAVPLSVAKGDYVTTAPVTLYQDKGLTKPAGVTVDTGYLIRIKETVDKNSSGVYYGRVAQYGNVPTGSDKLYVRMSDSIALHVTHTDTETELRSCDKDHYDLHVCKVVGCTKSYKDNFVEHSFSGGVCTVCGHAQVATAKGVYRIPSGKDVTLYSSNVSTSSTKGTAKRGTIIVVEQPALNAETGNYWAKVVWANGKKLTGTNYVYMGSLVSYLRPASVKIKASDKTYHYVQDGDDLFPEAHVWNGGRCEICGASQALPASGTYLASSGSIKAYKYGSGKYTSSSSKVYPSGSRLEIGAVKSASNGICYGKVVKCNGKKETQDYYVRLQDLTFHGSHAEGSEFFLALNDKQHTHDVKCPICGVDAKTKENHNYNESGVCVQCGAVKPADKTGTWYAAKKAVVVYKTAVESSQILTTLPAGTILKIGSVTWNTSGNCMGSGIVVMDDGTATNTAGYIRMNGAAFSLHEHSWTAKTLSGHREIDHIYERHCTVCGLIERINEGHVFRGGKCTVCGTAEAEHYLGEYTVKNQTASVYKDIAGKTQYTVLKEGDYVKVTKVVPDEASGQYRGLVTRIGSRNITGSVYISMNSLTPHKHEYQKVLFEAKDTYHLYKLTCAACGFVDLEPESHIPGVGGSCAVCGKAESPNSVGLYLAEETLTVYKSANGSASKVSKNATIQKGTHVYIDKVVLEKNVISTEEDQSYWGVAYWGRVRRAGKVDYSNPVGSDGNWIRMGSLSPANAEYYATYTPKGNVSHTVTYKCADCKLVYSVTEKHVADRSGTCIYCGCSTVAKGTLYTQDDNVAFYNIPTGKSGAVLFSLATPAGTIPEAGTSVSVLGDVIEEMGTVYCKVTLREAPASDWQPEWETAWVRRVDLTDHLHIAAGGHSPIDDKYHHLTNLDASGSSICKICGHEIPSSMVEKQEHIFEAGEDSCKVCGMKKVPQESGKYYAPYDGFCSYKGIVLDRFVPSQYAKPGTTYKAGDKIEVVTVSYLDGAYWGKVKNTDEFVVMSTLSLTPVKKAAARTLSDEEIINWCLNYHGYTSLHTYNYASTMLGTISEADLLLMAVNNRASGAADQIFTWVKEACGETLARKYYRMQVVSLLTSLEEEARYSVSVPLKSEIKDILKYYKLYSTYPPSFDNLTKTEQEAVKALNSKLGRISSTIGYTEDVLDLAYFLTMDCARMEGVLQAARAVQAQTANDPDLNAAFDDVLDEYETKYLYAINEALLKGESLLEKTAGKYVGDFVKDVTGFSALTAAAEWSDFSYVYSAVNFALDMTMELTGGAKLSKSSMKFMSQISVVSAADNAYSAAVNKIRDGDHSPAAVAAVRMQFEMYKAAVIELYKTMMSMACSHILDINEDSDIKNYLQCELDKLSSMYLADSYDEYPTGISFEDFMRSH